MDTKEKKGSLITFLMSLIICLVMFANPVHASDLQSQDDDNGVTMIDNQGAYMEEVTETVLDKTDSVYEASSESTQEKELEENTFTEEGNSLAEEENNLIEEEIVSVEKEQLSANSVVIASSDGAELKETQVGDSETNISTDSNSDLVEDEMNNASENKIENNEKTIVTDSKETTMLLAREKDGSETKGSIEQFVRPIKDGIYVIVSKINGLKALQTAEASNEAGKQIELHDCDGSNTQKFKLVSDAATGYYVITNVQSGKALAVKGDRTVGGTLIVQNTSSDSLGQKWILVEKDGYFMIQSALEGSPMLLSLRNGSTARGSDAVLEEAKNVASQMFSFLVSKPSVTINDGVYEISSALNNNMKWDILGADMYDKGNLQIYQSNDTNAQKFIVSKVSDNQYTITSYNSGKAIDLNAASKSPKANVQQYTKNGTTAQKWNIRNVGDGSLYITSSVSGLPLEAKNGRAANNTNIYVNTASGSKAQKFNFTKVADSKLKPIAEGVYLLQNAKNTNRVVAIEDGSRLQRANVQIQYKENASFQKFKFIYAGNGYYKIQNVKSKHMIDLKNASYVNNTNIQQWHDNGTPAQLWLPHKNTDGSYTFISAKSSKVFDVAGGSTADATNIWAYSFNNTGAQKFKLAKTSGSDSTAIDYGTVKDDSVLSAMCKKAQDYYSDTYYLILCNLTNHRLVLFKEIEGRWISVLNSPVSIGKASTPTPTGTFYVYNHWEYFDGDYNDDYLTYQCWWSTCFDGPYYFHSVLYDYNSGYPGRLRDGRMQVNVSHGCVRMPLENAKYLYDHSPIGTKVRVYK